MDWIETQTKQIISYTVVNLCTSDFQAVEVFCRSFKPETTTAAVLLPNPETTVTFTVSYHQVLLFVIPTAASHYLVIYLTFLSPSLIFFFFSSHRLHPGIFEIPAPEVIRGAWAVSQGGARRLNPSILLPKRSSSGSGPETNEERQRKSDKQC